MTNYTHVRAWLVVRARASGTLGANNHAEPPQAWHQRALPSFQLMRRQPHVLQTSSACANLSCLQTKKVSLDKQAAQVAAMKEKWNVEGTKAK